MTPDDLRTTLSRLGGHLATIIEDLETDPLRAVKQSQTGVRNTTTGSRPPCDTNTLDYLITDVGPRIRGWATELQRCAGVTGLPVNQPLNVWTAWLSRHRDTLAAQDWADTAADELTDLEAELRHRLHPTDPAQQAAAVTGLVTAEYLRSTGVKPGTVRQWRSRGVLEKAGEQRMSSGEVVDLYRFTRPVEVPPRKH